MRGRTPLTETLAETLRALPRTLDPEAWVFHAWTPEALSLAFGRFVRGVGLRNLTFHDLRHDAACTLTMAGVTQRAVMEILGTGTRG